HGEAVCREKHGARALSRRRHRWQGETHRPRYRWPQAWLCDWPDRQHCASKSRISEPASTGLLKQFPSDQHTPDFRRAGTDFVKLRIAQKAARRVVIDVAIAAQRLYRLQGHLRGVFRRIKNAARRILARGL